MAVSPLRLNLLVAAFLVPSAVGATPALGDNTLLVQTQLQTDAVPGSSPSAALGASNTSEPKPEATGKLNLLELDESSGSDAFMEAEFGSVYVSSGASTESIASTLATVVGRATEGGLVGNLLKMNVFLICAALVCIYRSCVANGRLLTQEGFLGMTKVSQVMIFFAYVALACTHTFTQHRSGSTGYSLIAATALIYLFKVLVAFVMFKFRGDGSMLDVFKSAQDLGQPRFGRMPVIVLLAFPAVSLAFYDLLSFMTLAKMDPVTYQILRSGRIVLIAGLWQPALGRILTKMQVAALLFFMAASMTKGIDQVGGAGGLNMESFASTGILLISVQILVSIFANVASEVCLKQIPLHTDLINCVGYSTGLVALLGFLVWQQGAASFYEQTLAPAAWGKLFGDAWMVASIVCLVTFGIVTAYFLRDLSNILKELSFGFVILVTAVVEYATTDNVCTALGSSAIILTVLAIMVYNADPVTTTPTPSKEGETKA